MPDPVGSPGFPYQLELLFGKVQIGQMEAVDAYLQAAELVMKRSAEVWDDGYEAGMEDANKRHQPPPSNPFRPTVFVEVTLDDFQP